MGRPTWDSFQVFWTSASLTHSLWTDC